jgi:hypothetical protein
MIIGSVIEIRKTEFVAIFVTECSQNLINPPGLCSVVIFWDRGIGINTYAIAGNMRRE